MSDFESPLTHPWRKYCTKRRAFLWRVLPLSACALALLIVVLVLDSLMKVKKDATHPYAVSGYSALEQARTRDRALEVLGSWDAKQRMTAAFSSGIHFLFLFLYPSVLAMLCCWGVRLFPDFPSRIQQANHSPMKLVGDVLAWLQLLGAIFDATLQVRTSAACATHKFAVHLRLQRHQRRRQRALRPATHGLRNGHHAPRHPRRRSAVLRHMPYRSLDRVERDQSRRTPRRLAHES